MELKNSNEVLPASSVGLYENKIVRNISGTYFPYYPALLDGPFQNAYDSLVAQIEGYECDSKSVIVPALHLEFLADEEIDIEGSNDEYDDYTRVQNCTIV